MSRLTSISVAMVCALAGACGETTATAATPNAALGGGLRELVSSYEAVVRGMLFYRLLEQAVVTDPVTYQDIVHPPLEPAEAA